MSDFIEVHNDHGLNVFVLPYGATLASVQFPDRQGNLIDLVLGFSNKEGYTTDTNYIGRTVGRVANRVRDAKFAFDGKPVQLVANDPPHHNHGGPQGIAFQEWETLRHSNSSVTFRVKIDEDLDNFPGDATIEVTYTVNDRNQLVIEHYATCSKAGVLAISNHPYWNLDGSESVKDHILEVASGYFLPLDSHCCPNGAILSVVNTPLDFRKPKKLSALQQKEDVITLDNDLVLDALSPCVPHHVRLHSEVSCIQMDMTTSYPVVHLYAGSMLQTTGRGGVDYGPNKGIAIEAQFHSAAVNYDNFPDVSLRPGDRYCREVVHTFSHIQ